MITEAGLSRQSELSKARLLSRLQLSPDAELALCKVAGIEFHRQREQVPPCAPSPALYPGVDLRSNIKSISHRCHIFEVGVD